MRYLILSDIHANAGALAAVLAADEAKACGGLISLGDQVNYGPEPARALDLLRDFARGREAYLLLGNHEERFRHMDDLRSYSWALLRWTERQVPGFGLDLPVDVRVGPVLCTHGTPGDPYHLVGRDALPALLDSLPEGVTHLLSGHNHIAWRAESHGRTAFNPGSCGMLEEETGGLAPFGVMEIEDGRVTRLERKTVPYDTEALRRAFVRSGCWREAPEFARVALVTMSSSEYHYTLRFMRHLKETAAAMGLTRDDEAAWKVADRTWPWPEPVDSERFWKQQ